MFSSGQTRNILQATFENKSILHIKVALSKWFNRNRCSTFISFLGKTACDRGIYPCHSPANCLRTNVQRYTLGPILNLQRSSNVKTPIVATQTPWHHGGEKILYIDKQLQWCQMGWITPLCNAEHNPLELFWKKPQTYWQNAHCCYQDSFKQHCQQRQVQLNIPLDTKTILPWSTYKWMWQENRQVTAITAHGISPRTYAI